MYPTIKNSYRREICDILHSMFGYMGTRTPQFVWTTN